MTSENGSSKPWKKQPASSFSAETRRRLYALACMHDDVERMREIENAEYTTGTRDTPATAAEGAD